MKSRGAKGAARAGGARLSIAPQPDQKPLDFGIVRRLFGYTRPYAGLRNGLFGLTLLRSLQLPLIAWATAKVVSGPIAQHDMRATALGVLGYLAWINLALGVFTWWNAATLLFNLTPAHPFDGALAWSLLRTRPGRTAARRKPRR